MALGILVVACGLLGHGMQALSRGRHVGSISPTRGAPCTGSSESYPLDHQGSPRANISNENFHPNRDAL